MFDAGLVEMLLIAVVALVVVGPERLPGIARKAGYWVGRVRRFVASAKAEMESDLRASEMRDLLNKQQSEIQELRHVITDAKQTIEDPLKDLRDKVDVEQSLADPAQALRSPDTASSEEPVTEHDKVGSDKGGS